jgi:single-strand DNA-binding protein
MARTKNRVELIGHVGNAPSIHYTSSGDIVASFTLATSEPYKDSKGEWGERPEWHNLVTFKRNAELVRDHIKKGSRLRVEGKLRTRDWIDRESGKKMYKTEVIVYEVMFLSPREENSNNTTNYEAPAAAVSTTQGNEPPYTDAEAAQYQDPEIPF